MKVYSALNGRALATTAALVIFFFAASGNADEFSYRRSYADGDQYGYELRTIVEINGEFSSEESAVSHHQVSTPGIPHEQIAWERLQIRTLQGVESADEIAGQVAPYEISLDPKGSLALPRLDVPQMKAMVTDLNTFFVAISPKVGVEQLRHVGDRYANANPAKGIWSDSTQNPLGEDCIQIGVSLAQLDHSQAMIQTEFLPPAQACLQMAKDWMKERVVPSLPNNMQQIRVDASGKYEVMWGSERFTTLATVAREDGKLLSATMDNALTLKMKIGCDSELDHCAAEFPLTLHRSLQLRLQR